MQSRWVQDQVNMVDGGVFHSLVREFSLLICAQYAALHYPCETKSPFLSFHAVFL